MQATRLIAFTVALLSAAAQAAADPVAASFERMLTHQPHHAAVARPAEPADPLHEAIVAALQRGAAPAPSVAILRTTDPVAAGFVRMLAHEPTHTRAPVPSGIDPLFAALIEPLREGSADYHAPRLAATRATTRP